MGKGIGKLYSWAIRYPKNTNIIVTRNINIFRLVKFNNLFFKKFNIKLIVI